MTRRYTLRTQLLLGVLLAVIITVLFTVFFIYKDARHELDELFDAQLEQLARTHLSIEHDMAQVNPSAPTNILHDYTSKILVRHMWADGRNPNHWESEPGAIPLTLHNEEGFGNFEQAEQHWRTLGLWSDDRSHHVLVLQDLAIREELASDIARHVSLQALIQIPLLALLILVLSTLALRPLRAIVLALRNASPLDVRLPSVETMPPELAIVVEAFNHLIERFRELIARERHFTATAAHELRTPLAGLSAQLQLLELTHPPDPHALAQAQLAARNLGALVERLLLLARMDRHQVQASTEPIDLYELVLEAAALVQESWPQRDIHWDIPQRGDACWKMRGDPALLRMLLLNLLDNACKHGNAAPQISIRAHCTASQRNLIISDNGSGIAPEQMANMQQRFTRASEHTEGLGLGLALAREIALLHHGTLTLAQAEHGGLRVSLMLPSVTE